MSKINQCLSFTFFIFQVIDRKRNSRLHHRQKIESVRENVKVVIMLEKIPIRPKHTDYIPCSRLTLTPALSLWPKCEAGI